MIVILVVDYLVFAKLPKLRQSPAWVFWYGLSTSIATGVAATFLSSDN